RAYSWETEIEKSKTPKQTNVFLSDLIDYNKSVARTPYYFGHFLFEKKKNDEFGVIDGQQRLTTIVIFLSALFTRLRTIRELSEDEQECYEDIIKRKSKFRFATVDYDTQLFNDYVVDQTKKNKNGLETESAKRIVQAFDFFAEYLSDKTELFLLQMLKTINEASCTTHPVEDESEAIQMFIFQNNRGKKPSNLEIIKAQFMFSVHLFGGEEKVDLIAEIKNRFEKIYKSISSIEYNIDEDDVLIYTLRVHFNSLWEADAINKINNLLSENNPIPFIKSFTHSLAISFEHLTNFFNKDERENIEIHSLVTLGGIAIAIPFIIKGYKFGLRTNQICKLCSSLESVVLRHRLVGTRADITSRLNDVYQVFTEAQPDINPILERIDWMKNVSEDDSWWWAYWNNSVFEKSLQGAMNHSTAKFLLWKYENFLEDNLGKKGYTPTRFDRIIDPELEHIAPQTPTNDEPIAAGYCEYDEEFMQQYIDCLGNYLLLSKSHNCSVGNSPFADKRNTYNKNEQQREIQNLTAINQIWTKELITQRKNKIISDFILKTF
ncbi:MAG: DUF262 domain-containing protein, partial [Chitinophagales bacterium]|nr:DUF262 domain-containing protein [Chitinophagales bacterium]